MIEILNIILQWKKQILIFTAIATVVSIIITMPFIMPPYYKSNKIFYVANPMSTDRAALFNEKVADGVSMFGGKEDVNRFLSILTSDIISTKIIEKYNLVTHYHLSDNNKALAQFYTKREFYNNFKAIRNDLGAIEVSVLDTDANLAAVMAKDIVHLSDSIYRQMLSENKAVVLSLLDKQIADKKTETQKNMSANAVDELQKLMSIRDQYAVSSSVAFKTIYTVGEAAPAVKKTKPVRWLIVLATALGALFFASFITLLIDLFKHADQNNVQHS